MNAMSISLFLIVVMIPLSSVTALFLPDFGNCPGGIETMADFDMAQVSEGEIHTICFIRDNMKSRICQSHNCP